MKKTSSNQNGFAHLVLAVVIVAVVAAIGGFIAYKQYGPSKINDASTKAAVEKASKDLKSVDLAGVKSSVDGVKSVASGYKK